MITAKKHSLRVQPRAARRGEVRGDPRVRREPGADAGVLVRAVVAADDVQVRAGVGGGDFLQELQELQELLVPVPGVAGVGDLAGGDVEGGEQAGHPVLGIVS